MQNEIGIRGDMASIVGLTEVDDLDWARGWSGGGAAHAHGLGLTEGGLSGNHGDRLRVTTHRPPAH
jgi:hypothetical protein